MARRQVPPRGNVGLPAATFRDDLLAYQEPELDPDAGETDAVAACLGARRHIVIARELAPSHARAVVDGGERRRSRVGREMDAARAGSSGATGTTTSAPVLYRSASGGGFGRWRSRRVRRRRQGAARDRTRSSSSATRATCTRG